MAASKCTLTAQDWEEVKAAYGHHCAWCREAKPLTIDHKVPLVKGGETTKENIQPLCRECNASKNARTIHFDPDGSGVEVTDFMALVQAVADGRASVDFIIPKQDALDELAQSLKGQMRIPGVKAVCTRDVAAGRR